MRRLKLLVILLACIAGPMLAGAVLAGPLDEANAAYVKGDYAAAADLYRPLAEQGNATAQYTLGTLYERGRGVAKDQATAVAWFRKAADQGDAKAQFNLGFRYSAGLDVSQDDVQAYMWLDLAAAQRTAFAEDDRKRIVQTRDIVALKMPPAQLTAAKKLVQEWKPK
jgi:TPR repeat protein